MLGQGPGTVIEARERSDNLRDGVAVLDEHLGVAPETSTETPNTYSVGCSTLTTGPDALPRACNDLYQVRPVGSDLEDFGATCGYRLADWSYAGELRPYSRPAPRSRAAATTLWPSVSCGRPVMVE